ncbi:hypothetical protein BKA56DRAFT_229744 [Ilyonectria sp. MPI-CAGE-AT-0026]|nr:hypothetical protein BKA56DRAFT_229744 [Ilyonectria sp. MPI-CAGE-AT-0026]
MSRACTSVDEGLGLLILNLSTVVYLFYQNLLRNIPLWVPLGSCGHQSFGCKLTNTTSFISFKVYDVWLRRNFLRNSLPAWGILSSWQFLRRILR